MDKLSRAKRILLAAIFALSASACSSMPDWANPDTWGDSSEPSTAVTDDSGAAAGQYPVLADTPSKAPPTTSTDEQKQVANALVADRAQAQYSSEQLRAGAEPSAAPPAPASADSGATSPAVSEPASSGSGSAPNVDANPVAMPPPATVTTTSAPVQSTPGTRVASAVPSAPTAHPPPPSPSGDAALGFQPSHAPPLDPSVSQIVGSPARPRLALAASAPAAPVAYGTPAATVVLGNANGLDANGQAQVQAAVAAFRAKGGQGFVRVVGHAAGGAASTPQVLERAQACATAVARELIRLGVPARRVLVEASGRADGGQRRADIYIAS